MPSSLFNRLLLISALLFAQMGGLAHGISHALTDSKPSQRSEQSLPHDKYCDQCAAYAQIGSAVGSNTVNFFLGETCETLNFNSFSSCLADTFVAFAARAPPSSV
ncbi:MAG: hypothetical protein ABIS30_11730 [Gallionella sp.]|jgi:hypothetical protein